MLLVGTLKLPKLWYRFSPPPGLVPPVMLYCVCPLARGSGALTCVLRPDDVMGAVAWTREGGFGTPKTSEQPTMRQVSSLACSAARLFNVTCPLGIAAHPPTRFPKANRRQNTLLLNARCSSSSFLTSRTAN